ncbi:FG-GAP-like repeat-containing protein [Paludibaculum fermentans]|uniref:VCBS repeat-containing protein n=1 Tax=Paludibaculum fermentans TaxID=1473598 RepID=A0A7S7NXN8_PALFE|nr:FG-GAP-like repeat-containing protein [Paludibaculum fermentans]QOY91684.1 VCBS repeat-containing protein [Paludibaculum fermentans]
MKRRQFLAGLAAGGLLTERAHAFAPYPLKFRLAAPYAPALSFVEAGSDEFTGEKAALDQEHQLSRAVREGTLPFSKNCRGGSPAPRAYETLAEGVSRGAFGAEEGVAEGWTRWRASLGEVRSARFYALPDNIARFDIRALRDGRLEHRTGAWRVEWDGAEISRLEPLEETLVRGEKPWFHDVTGHAFEDDPAFREQLARGVPYWRARLDPACGLDVYGENGVAVADIDGDGLDEIYICQPGGLPNRLYKWDGGRLKDISAAAGLDLLDDTACALFVDLRNSGRQDLVLVRSNQPLLFLNDGHGKFQLAPDVFRFATKPQGSFTSVAAADFDRDGRLDLYFCCYVYYQSEAQYRYPVPYHDAQNGPPNFLFRNRLNEKPGYFEDVTAATGMNHNNNRFSFAATWCDYNGDGWPDLYVTNDFGRKNLYRNVEGQFRDVAEEAGVVDLGPGMSAAWLDYDGDGRPDLLVSNMWSACGQRVVNDAAFGPVRKDPALLSSYRHHVKGNSLYRNLGDGRFEYTGDAQGIEMCPWSWSCDGADVDNDGSPELYVACGMVNNGGSTDLMSYFYRQVVAKSPVRQTAAPAYENGWNAINQLIRQDYSWAAPEPNMFFARRAGRYYNFSGVSGLDLAEDSRAFAFTDIDGDGNLDIVLKSRCGPQVRVLQNDCGVDRNKLVLALRGTKSNRDAIGARVEVDGQVKWIAAGSGYLSQHTKRLHFGLSNKSKAEKVTVLWPTGERQDLGPLAAGFLYEVVEGQAQVAAKPLAKPSAWPKGPAVVADNVSRLHSTWFWEPVPLPEKRRGPGLLVVHAGETLPSIDGPVDRLDLRQAPVELAAAYSILRRYLFDHRVELETPLWLLVDGESKVRKIYAEAPDGGELKADLQSLGGPLPEPRGLPFPGIYTGRPRRDYYKFGGALLQAGYPEQALPYLEEMLRRTPDNPKALLAVGRIHLEGKRFDLARGVLQRAVELDPRLPEGWNELGGVEAQAGRWPEALKYYEKALALAPELPYVLLNAAHAQEEAGHGIEAERLFRRLLELEPNNVDAANGLGLFLAKQGKTDEARKLFEKAISIRRDDSSAINNLGVLYMNIGQPNDAIAAFRYGIQVAPDNETLYLNLARVHVQLGQRESARGVMRELLAKQPGNAMAQRALKSLEGQ